MDLNSEENHLTLGESALQQGDYDGAIERLKKVCQNTKDPKVFSSAQRSLITAYQKSGKIEAAINQCKQLQKLGEVEDQIWATTQLNELNKSQNPLNLTGFVADTPPASPPQKTKTDSLPTQKQEPVSKTPSQTPIKKPKPKQKKQIKATPKPEVKKQQYTLPPDAIEWKNAPGAKKWQPLKKPSLSLLWRRIVISLIAFFFLFDASIQLFMKVTNDLLVALPHFRPIQLFYRDPTIALIIFIIIVFSCSPFLLNFILKRFYKCQPLPIYKLNTRCPIAAKLAQRYCNQYSIPLPTFGIIPTNAPLIFSYGQSPKNARIILSEGLLIQLTDEEVATLLAGEIGMIRYLPFLIFSGSIALLQIPYTFYFQLTHWGEMLYQNLPKQPPRFIPKILWRDIPPLVRNSSAYVGQLFYLAYRLWKLPLNLLFQAQHFDRDYLSVSLTGNPNAKVRGLLKIIQGMNHSIETEKQTSYILESFSPLFPVAYSQGLHLGSLFSHLSLEKSLSWESSQTDRQPLNWFNIHPLVSDRVANLLQWAKQYKLTLELDISSPTPPRKSLGRLLRAYRKFPLLQRSLYTGIILGFLLRFAFWGIGIISNQLDIMTLSWFAEAESFLTACILFIFSLSLIVSINHYFPNIKVSNTNNNPSLAQWLTTINHPQEVYPIRIKGTLLGRKGISNWLGQDLILKTETGTIFLHVSSRLGWVGNVIPNFPRPNEFIEQPVIVSGWLRRGVIPWLDVERITNDQRQSLRAGYPVWLTLLAIIAAVWGTQLILNA
ncbi:UNVERIFIED_CONTAM: hypothetical protein BEN50_16665 [Euhalothece sp. KZN 001]